jgi:hypothetical protein
LSNSAANKLQICSNLTAFVWKNWQHFTCDVQHKQPANKRKQKQQKSSQQQLDHKVNYKSYFKSWLNHLVMWLMLQKERRS